VPVNVNSIRSPLRIPLHTSSPRRQPSVVAPPVCNPVRKNCGFPTATKKAGLNPQFGSTAVGGPVNGTVPPSRGKDVPLRGTTEGMIPLLGSRMSISLIGLRSVLPVFSIQILNSSFEPGWADAVFPNVDPGLSAHRTSLVTSSCGTSKDQMNVEKSS